MKIKQSLPTIKEAYKHKDVTINYCLVGKSYPVEDFIRSLSDDQKKGIVSLFEMFAERKGQLFNRGAFKKLEDVSNKAIFEFKTGQVRIAGFWGEQRLNFNLIYGMIKKQDKWPQKDMNNMKRNYRAFHDMKK